MIVRDKLYTDLSTASQALAQKLASAARKGIAQRGHSSIAVSGGKTPQKVFELLRNMDVEWGRVIFTLTDERWVPADHVDSNEGMVRSHLFRGRAASAKFISLYGGETTSEAGIFACENRLKKMPLPFDAVYLGIGSDGHFASIFPNDTAIDVKEGLCTAVSATQFRIDRMSLTVPTLLNATNVFILFAGAEKNAIYAEARKDGPYNKIPLRLILTQKQTPVVLFRAP